MLEVAIYSGGVTGEMKPPHIADTLPKGYRGREQTFIKHLILERYLERVAFNILSAQQDFAFVDGFSGPWASQSSNYEDTSFGKAIRRLRHVRDEWKQRGRDCRVRCIFVEKGASAFARLEQAVKSTTDIEAKAIHGRFEERVQEVGHLIGNAFSLIFIDPKGWTFDLQRMKPLLCHRPGEVLINLMFEHLNRFLDDRRARIRDSYVLPFGPDWRKRFDVLRASGLGREQAVLELFRDNLKTIGNFEYVLSARIQRTTVDRSHFYLVYGTRHPKGLVEFRSIERKAMEAEELTRMQAKRDKRFSKHSTKMLTYREAMTGVLERFSVTEPELKDLLVGLNKAGLINLHGMIPRQRKPKDGVFIERGSAPWPDPQGG